MPEEWTITDGQLLLGTVFALFGGVVGLFNAPGFIRAIRRRRSLLVEVAQLRAEQPTAIPQEESARMARRSELGLPEIEATLAAKRAQLRELEEQRTTLTRRVGPLIDRADSAGDGAISKMWRDLLDSLDPYYEDVEYKTVEPYEAFVMPDGTTAYSTLLIERVQKVRERVKPIEESAEVLATYVGVPVPGFLKTPEALRLTTNRSW
jgi:HAMP domain-containing protein